jgi:copper oxidase (laccase) domain-containing protein
VRALVVAFGSRTADLVAAVGPSIGPCCYEVGDDVRTAFRDAGFLENTLARWFATHPRSSERNPSMQRIAMRQRKADRWFFDPSAAACHQLEEAGLVPTQIFAAGLCTASHPSLCSYRRDGLAAGRLAAVIRSRRLDP